MQLDLNPMLAAPIPVCETNRLAALHRLRVLDTDREPVFERLTALASRLFSMPIVLISLVDKDRQWFKSSCGLGNATETSRDIAFCAHAILSEDVLLVPDARLDPRFADNPLVTGPPGVRFYAGAPLETPEGERIGTLCLIDTQPRTNFGPTEGANLMDLAAVVVDELELRLRLMAEAEAHQKLERANEDAKHLIKERTAQLQQVHAKLQSETQEKLELVSHVERARSLEASNARLRREIRERVWTERRIGAQYAVARILAEVTSGEEAFPRLLEALCRNLHWQAAEAWKVEGDGMRLSAHWYGEAGLPHFESAGRNLVLASGNGLPGQAWMSGKPVWIENVQQDAGFLRTGAAQLDGLRAAFSFPISYADSTWGAIVCFHQQAFAVNDSVLQMAAVIGEQVGQFLERVRVQKALEESELRFRALVEQATDALLLYEPQGRAIMDVNDRAAKSLGYSRAELLTLTIDDIEQKASEVFGQTLVGEQVTFQSVHRRKDGATFPVEVSAGLCQVGERPLVLALARDIGARLKAEAALSESESILHSFYDSAVTMMGVVELLEGEEIFNVSANAASARFFGLLPDQMRGCLLSEFDIPREVLRRWVQCLRESEQTRQPVRFEYARTNNGAGWMSAIVCFIARQTSGRPRFAYLVDDVTESKQAQEELIREQAFIQAVLTNVEAGIVACDARGVLTLSNQAALEIYGLPQKTLLPEQWPGYYDLYSPDHTPIAQGDVPLLRALRGEAVHALEIMIVPKGGEERLLLASGQAIYNLQGEKLGAVVIMHDITESKRSEKALGLANAHLTEWVGELKERTQEVDTMAQLSQILQACLDIDEAYEVIGPAMELMFKGLAGEIGLMASSRSLIETVVTWGALGSRRIFAPHECWGLRRGRAHRGGEGGAPRCRHLDAHHTAGYLCVPLMAQGESLGMLTLREQEPGSLSEAKQRLAIIVAEQIALALANLKLRETLQRQSTRDGLTGLFNRRHLEETLDRAVRQTTSQDLPFSIVMLDVDHFKRFNDTFGHDAGDAVLKEVARCLDDCVRTPDITCRYGGEEFVVLLPGATREVAVRRAEQLRRVVEDLHLSHRGQVLGTITISLGVASLPEHGSRAQEVFLLADEALYQAKKNGRNQVVAATPLAPVKLSD